ncbi:hypothetical protein [Chondrinema litorale]|uniref:hypothetical protein n=1 Tax=Chondrinema litorale TaxID=2994555 RepID=UPI0025436E95|nr:hypothetical protein [Chondrinema litorale]UZR95373.1 hypothetical protein OQ292_06015 [Chondrinema litorale]
MIENQSNRVITYEVSDLDSEIPSSLYYSYTYNYQWINRHENILSQYEFEKTDYLRLSDSELQIRKSEKTHIFSLKEIKSLDMEFRYLIIPLIIGGIVLSLSLVSIFSAVVESWVGMMLVSIGVILLYFGIKGSYQVSVETFSSKFSFFLDDEDKGLQSFLAGVNNYRRGKMNKF